MTQEHYEHGPLVEAWLKEPTFVPATDLGRVSKAIASTPQRSNRTFRLPQMRFQHMFDATKAAAAVAILGISGTLLVTQLGPAGPDVDRAPAAAVETAPSTAAASPTVEPVVPAAEARSGAGYISIPDELPAGVRGGVIETPAGPARWVHVPAPSSKMTPSGSVLPWTDGIAYFTRAGLTGQHSPGSLMASTDGVTWDEVPLSPQVEMSILGRATSVQHLDGASYVINPQMGRLWRYGGDGKWQHIDATAARKSMPRGWDRTTSAVHRAGLADGKPTIAIQHGFRLPSGRLGLPDDRVQMYHLDGQTYAICGYGGRDCTRAKAKRLISFKETGKGLVVRDERSGERLGVLKNARASELYSGRVGSTKQWFEIEGDALVARSRPPSDLSDAEPARPPEAPAVDFEVDVFHNGSTWAAGERTWGLSSLPWLHLGGVWVPPADYGFTGGADNAWAVSGAGNATLIWSWGDGSSAPGLYVVESPSAS